MDCFDKNINVLDENATNFSIMSQRHRRQVLNMLKTCFPYNNVNNKQYFDRGHQRIICLYRRGSDGGVEIVAVCFLQPIGIDKCFIHSVCVKKSRQGQKCCDRLFSYIVSNYGNYDMFLSVRVDTYSGQGLPTNKPAIKCYMKYGFVFSNELCDIQPDGLNCKMFRNKNT
jgi:ribosomal protein S18 acetylase RimI-like enzyme